VRTKLRKCNLLFQWVTMRPGTPDDSAVLSENFYAGLINIIYGLNLTNANNFERNSQAIDLHDINAKICAQVTIRQDRGKYNDTIDVYIKNKLYEKYDTLYIFVLGYKEKLDKDFNTKGLFLFDHKEHIVSLHELIPKIATLNDNVQDEINDYIVRRFKFPIFVLDDYTEQHFSQEIWGYVEAIYQNSYKCVVPDFLGRSDMNPQHFYEMACDALDQLKLVLSKRKIYISKSTQEEVEFFILESTKCLDFLRIFSANHDPRDKDKTKYWNDAYKAIENNLTPIYQKTTELLQDSNLYKK
jgi:hypothetical protein